MISEVNKGPIQDGEMRLKDLQERLGKEQLKIGSCGRNWERPMFSSGLIRSDDDDDDDDDDD